MNLLRSFSILSIRKEHGAISLKALTLIGFPSTYLRESAFSTVVVHVMKSQAGNRLLDIEPDLRCAISKF